jgi:hypothetical protein
MSWPGYPVTGCGAEQPDASVNLLAACVLQAAREYVVEASVQGI